MSILLEALKKSEAQRRLGKTPTLDSPAADGQSNVNEKIWIPAAMLFSALVVIGWIGSAQFERPEGAGQEPVATPQATAHKTTADEPAAGAGEQSDRSAKTPVSDYSAPAAAVASARDASRRASAQRLTGASKRNTTGRRPGAAASTVEEASVAVVDQPAAAGTGEKDTAEERPRQSDRMEPYVAHSISYWQVPQSVRADLPELHISVLVYAENPQDRFLLLNGQRLHEMQEFESGMVLEEIQRDRAIFNYRNYRFSVKH